MYIYISGNVEEFSLFTLFPVLFISNVARRIMKKTCLLMLYCDQWRGNYYQVGGAHLTFAGFFHDGEKSRVPSSLIFSLVLGHSFFTGLFTDKNENIKK